MNQTHEEPLEVRVALETLRALYPGGLDDLPRHLARALERDDYSEALAEANAAYSKAGPRELAPVLAYVALLNGRGLAQEAKGILRKAQAFYERDVALQLLQLQTMVLDEDQHDAALAMLEGLGHVPIQDPRYLGFMGELYLELEAPDEAMRCFELAVERGCQDVEIPYQLAMMRQDQEQWFDAAHAFELAARLQISEPSLWQDAANAWTQAEEYGKAAECMRRVVKLNGDDEYAWLYYGVALCEDGQLDRARGALERATKLDPFLMDAWVQLAHVERELGFVEEAMQHYRQALTLRKDNLEAMHGLIAAAFESGDLIMAEKMAREALVLAPQDADGHYNLGTVLHELNRNAEASESFERAVALDGSVATFAFALAVSMASQDKIEEAITQVKNALKTHPWAPEELLLEFVEVLLRKKHAARALTMLDEVSIEGPLWTTLAAMLRFIAAALDHQRERLDALALAFDEALRAFGQEYPEGADLHWDFDELERLIARLDHETRRRAEDMIQSLERDLFQAA